MIKIKFQNSNFKSFLITQIRTLSSVTVYASNSNIVCYLLFEALGLNKQSEGLR
jgi:hypothetical protein